LSPDVAEIVAEAEEEAAMEDAAAV